MSNNGPFNSDFLNALYQNSQNPVPSNPFSPVGAPLQPGVQFPNGYTSPGPFINQGGPPSGPTVSPSSDNVYQQIEATAGLYEPAVYQLLSFYSALLTQPDELDGQFVPLTDVRPTNNTQTLLFAVGILPPSSNVTGRILDRSATIVQSMPLTIPVNTNPVAGSVAAGTATGPYNLSANGVNFIAKSEGFVPNPYYATPAEKAKGLQTIGYGHLIQPGQNFPVPMTPEQGQALLAQDSIWAANEVNKYVKVPLTQNQFDACVSYVYNTGNIRNAPFLPTLNAGNYSGAAQQWLTSTVKGVDGNVVPGLLVRRTNESNLFSTPDGSTYGPSSGAKPSIPSTSAVINGDGSNPANQWKGSGSQQYAQAQQNLATLANNNLNTSNLGQSFQNAQATMINATLQAIQTMQNTPPLKMLVNPQSFKLSAEKIISDGEWGRNGPIVEQWGEALDKIEASGKVAAFYSLDAQTGSGLGASPTNPGITRIARQYSSAYQNFLSLWLLYKNNGGIYLNPLALTPAVPAGGTQSPLSSQPSNLSVLGSIYIYYDNILYIGSFDSFNLTESETAPYTLEYNFSFTVRATFLLDNTDDLSQQIANLGTSQLNPLAGLPSTNQIATTPGALALASQNAQPAGGVNPPPGLTPQQYASIGASAPGSPSVGQNPFTNRPR